MGEYKGKQTIDWLYKEQLRVDDEWAVRTPNGFKWWPYKNAQTVEVIGEELGPDGNVGYLVSVRTDFLRDVDLNEDTLRYIGSNLMALSAMCGPVYDEAAGTLSLCSLVRVHEGIYQWMNPIISVAAVTQVSEAILYARVVTEDVEVVEAFSEHPINGPRPEPDEMAFAFETLIAPLGKQPCRWSESEFTDAVDRYMQEPPSLMANGGGLGLTLEFPFGEQSSLCRINGDVPHPIYGNGLFLLQSFPIPEMSESEGVRLALKLNRTELTERPSGYGFGSFAYRDNNMHFTSFFPNAIYKPGLLPNLYYACAERSRMMSITLAGEDWTAESFSPDKSAAGRIMSRILGK